MVRRGFDRAVCYCCIYLKCLVFYIRVANNNTNTNDNLMSIMRYGTISDPSCALYSILVHHSKACCSMIRPSKTV